MVPFLIAAFEKEALSNLVKECFGSDFPDIFNKAQIDYIYRYLSDLIGPSCQGSVLLEFEYIEKDYLDDYAKFYARQFSNRGHRCARMHFFSKPLSHDCVEKLLRNPGDHGAVEDLQINYLGFMVVKPLPFTFIGKTCLKLYPHIQSGASTVGPRYALSRSYKVSLFGVDLSVESIAFQEQDKVVSACATTAIWSTIHAMIWKAERDIPSLSQITTNAINFIRESSNSFPSRELTTKQILRAIDVSGLRHHALIVAGSDAEEMGEIIRSYIASGFPIILTGTVGKLDGEAEILADHAISVLGYTDSEGLDRVESLYVHDDRLGPFAKARLVGQAAYTIPGRPAGQGGTVIEFQRKDGGTWQPAHEFLIPATLIVATPQNVRAPLSGIVATANGLARLFVDIVKRAGRSLSADSSVLTFCYRLRPINDIKREFRNELQWRVLDGAIFAEREDASDSAWDHGRLSFLTRSFARWHWVVEVRCDGRNIFNIHVDATDAPDGSNVSAILYLPDGIPFLNLFRQYANAENPSAELNRLPFFKSFLRQLKLKKGGLAEHLDAAYGELRAPLYIKKNEIANSSLTDNESKRVFYEPTGKDLVSFFPDLNGEALIWVIDQEGSLVVGIEKDAVGHPALTGSKPARIAGELHQDGERRWLVNTKSGRYSGDHGARKLYLKNAIIRFGHYFSDAFAEKEENPAK